MAADSNAVDAERAGAAVRAAGGKALFGMGLEELRAVVEGLGLKRYRAVQLGDALYKQRVERLEEITTLPVALREELAAQGYGVGLPELVQTAKSVDGTERYLVRCGCRAAMAVSAGMGARRPAKRRVRLGMRRMRSRFDPTSQKRDAHPNEQARWGPRDVGHPHCRKTNTEILTLPTPASKARRGPRLRVRMTPQGGRVRMTNVIWVGISGRRFAFRARWAAR
jgi:hypothetical protein